MPKFIFFQEDKIKCRDQISPSIRFTKAITPCNVQMAPPGGKGIDDIQDYPC
jgi:hypothetical protein